MGIPSLWRARENTSKPRNGDTEQPKYIPYQPNTIIPNNRYYIVIRFWIQNRFVHSSTPGCCISECRVPCNGRHVRPGLNMMPPLYFLSILCYLQKPWFHYLLLLSILFSVRNMVVAGNHKYRKYFLCWFDRAASQLWPLSLSFNQAKQQSGMVVIIEFWFS